MTDTFGKPYGKFPTYGEGSTILMDYDSFLEWALDYMNPEPPEDFKIYIRDNPKLLEQYADFLMYTLPLPRYKWY